MSALARRDDLRPTLIPYGRAAGGARQEAARADAVRESPAARKARVHGHLTCTHDQAERAVDVGPPSRCSIADGGGARKCAPPAELLRADRRNRLRRRVHRREHFHRGTVTRMRRTRLRVRSRARATIVAEAVRGSLAGTAASSSIRPQKLSYHPTNHPYDNEIAVKFVARIYVGDSYVITSCWRYGGPENRGQGLTDPSAPKFRRGHTGACNGSHRIAIAFPTPVEMPDVTGSGVPVISPRTDKEGSNEDTIYSRLQAALALAPMGRRRRT